ncbi:large subunit ribosomal protein L29 [Thermonema lapsum]|jgi:large subunit ribosomal protein L29|uniref:Large ribosomal subunit protein uL29 n=1 Tax=Thermonema lapsum TaxID=28195 RepID=A0A846MTB9_9BACT|nr:50S ribosomal protein L29 [Thermonema lapsum]NIK74572.1 large subunit ribosomal protein L29 [Thermonema lapsum]
MKMQEIRALSTAELQAKLKEEKRNLQKLRFANAISPIENPMRIRETKKLIARILTELRARELGIAPSKAE